MREHDVLSRRDAGHASPAAPDHRTAFRRLCLAAAFVMLCAMPGAAQSLISNGSFESDYSNWLASGSQAIATGESTHPASAGSKTVVLNRDNQTPTAVLSQTFTTVIGQRYALTFDVGTTGATSDQHLRVGLTGATTLLDRELVFGGPTAAPAYFPQRVTFVANSVSTTLTFTDVSPSFFFIDGLLDNVRVVAEASGLPTITADPQRAAAGVGGSATFAVAASGGTLSYQWQFNGVDIAGATASSYTVTSASASKAGAYRVRVTNATGSVVSSAVPLVVVPAALVLNGSFEFGAIGWTLSNQNVDVTMNTAYTFSDGVQLMHFGFGQRPSNGVVSQTFPTVPGRQYILTFDLGAFSFSNHDPMSGTVRVQGSSTLLSQSLVIYATGNGTTYQGQIFNFVADSASTTLSFTDTSATTLDVDLVLDNVRVEEWGEAPTITSQPQSLTVAAGGTATFSVVASGAGTISYQWRLNGQTIGGATSSSYTVNNAQAANAGPYDVVVSNAFGSTPSDVATLTVQGGQAGPFTNGSFESDYTGWTPTGNQGVVLDGAFGSSVSHGAKAVVFNAGQKTPNGVLQQTFATTAGQTYTLAFDAGAFSMSNQDMQRMQVTVQGSATLLSQLVVVAALGTGTHYVPQSFAFVADQSAATLVFADLSQTTMDVDLFLDNVRVTSAAAQPPQITTQPQSLTVVAGNAATFSVAATGSGTLTYQWRFNSQAIANATASTYTVNNAQAANAGPYDVIVSNSVGPTPSNVATLTVQTSQAQAFTNGSFESDYTGWTQTGNQSVVLNGAFGSTVSHGTRAVAFNAGQKTPNGVLQQTFATTPGQTYTLAFDVGAFSLSNQSSQRMQVTVQGSTTLLSQLVTVAALGTGTRYVAQSFTFVANQSAATLVFTDVSQTTTDIDLFLDNVRVTSATPTPPQITSQPQSLTVVAGNAATFSVSATGTGTLTYQWRFNGQAIANATASSYTVSNAQPVNAGPYDVIVSNSAGPTHSNVATLTVQAGQLLTNGSFESDYSGWTQSGNQSVVLNGAFGSSVSDGTKAVAFNAGQQTPNGTLSQTFVTTAGRTYTLTFDAGAFSMANQSAQRIRAVVQGTTTRLTQTVTVTAPGNGTRYVAQSFSFTADRASTTLTFTDLSQTTTDVDLFLDNVRITPTP